MAIEIKHWSGRVLYTSETAADVRQAVQEAAREGAILSGAILRGAILRGAVLRGAVLSGAILRGADLSDAVLSGADLRRAVLSGADLSGAILSGADLSGADLSRADLSGATLSRADLSDAETSWRSPLYAPRLDMHAILDSAPSEVALLRAKLVAGEVNGSTYEGECACLVGTIAPGNTYEQVMNAARSVGITPDSSRPAEQWFEPIRRGDAALLSDERPDDGWPSEGVYRATMARRWLDQWVELRAAAGPHAAAIAALEVSDER